MSVLDLIGVIDIRDKLPKRDWIIGQRSATTNGTWHWNGPAVREDRQHGAGLIDQLRIDAEWQMRKGWGGTKNGAPHLMYTIVIDALGTRYLVSDLIEMLWHAAHQDANSRGFAIHYPLGRGQQPTSPQIYQGERTTDILRSFFSIPLNRILGHLEWKHATECPGPDLMQALIRYRAGLTPTPLETPIPVGLRRWQVNPLFDLPVRIHQAPRLDSPLAPTRLKPGTIVYVDVVKDSEIHDPNHPRWVHMARVPHEQADLGFIAEDCGVWL